MSVIARRVAIIGSCFGVMLPEAATRTATAASKSIGQKWIEGWNASDPGLLVAVFTPDAIYEDVAFEKEEGKRVALVHDSDCGR